MPAKKINISFVCRGNTYRSRLASAYMATLVDGRFVVSSSGINPPLSAARTINPYTREIAEAHGLSFDLKRHKKQTTDALLAEADIVVFMNQDIYDEAISRFAFDTRKAIVWQVADMEEYAIARRLPYAKVTESVAIAARAFQKIRRQCDELYEYVCQTGWVDITDEHDELTGLRLPLNWASDKGLWHRSCHVVLMTNDGKFVVEKRSKNIIFSPGLLDISLGGSVDCGETPLQAAIRETREELGVSLEPSALRLLFIRKWSSYHPHYQKYTRCYTYVYQGVLPVHSQQLQSQPSEVDSILFLSRRQVSRLLRYHHLRHIGGLQTSYVFYARAVRETLRST